jgi:hypothetical protein
VRRHWKKLALLLAGIAIAAPVIFAVFGGKSEPSYQGRTITDWIDDRNAPDETVAEAFRQMGTNALPYLVSWTCPTNSKWKDSISRFAFKHQSTLPQVFLNWVNRDTHRMFKAEQAFGLLRTNAYPALPLLMARANAKDPFTSQQAIKCIVSTLYGTQIFGYGPKVHITQQDSSEEDRALIAPNPAVRQAAEIVHPHLARSPGPFTGHL